MSPTPLVEGERLGAWMSRLSHDLRNQLAPMRTASQLLRSGRLDEPREAEMLELLDRQIQRIVRMLDDLSELGQHGGPPRRRIVEPLDLGLLLDTALEECERRLRDAMLTVERQPTQRPWPVQGEYQRLLMVFLRLLDNAARFTPPGGRVRIEMSEQDGMAEVRVSDSGCGLEAAQIDDVFALPESTRHAEGLGISLGLARASAVDHGGSLHAESGGLGRGSCFVLRLPLSTD